MKPEIKTKWVEALRSGEYKQTFGELKSFAEEECYCALGVLVRLAEKEGIPLTEGVWDYVSLPVEVRQWAGLSDNNPSLTDEVWEETGEGSVMGLNDSLRLPFPEIANYIEEGLKNE